MSNTDNNSEIEEADDFTSTSVAYDDEDIIWEGGPSQWVNFWTFLWWSIFFIISIVMIVIWEAGLSQSYSLTAQSIVYWSSYGLIGLSLINILYAYLAVHYEHTTITPNKIKEAKGITRMFREELFCENSDIIDIKSPPPGVMGILGLSTLLIETKDEDQPLIKIRAIRSRDELIKKLQPIRRKLKMERKGYF